MAFSKTSIDASADRVTWQMPGLGTPKNVTSPLKLCGFGLTSGGKKNSTQSDGSRESSTARSILFSRAPEARRGSLLSVNQARSLSTGHENLALQPDLRQL